MIDTIVQAVAQATTNCVAAGHHAAMGSHRFQGINPKTDRLFSHLDTAHGGWGASLGRDGAGPFKTMAHGDTLDVPVEVQEALYPLVVDYLGFLSDSGGAGQQRGGLGLQKGYTIQHPCKLTLTFERFGCPAWGLAGGGPGKPGFVEIQRRGSETRDMFLKATDIPLSAGDRIFIRTGGGGGYGDPLERSPRDVVRDVRSGYVTVRGALAEYGVVLDAGGKADEAATLGERSKRVGVGQERDMMPSGAAAQQSVAPSGEGSCVLSVKHLRKEYVTRRSEERVLALDDISMELRDREFVSVLGASGCGKTTLLKILAGIVPYTEGDILFRSAPLRGPQSGMGISSSNRLCCCPG